MFDRNKTVQIANEIEAALKEIAKKHGFSAPMIDLRRSRDGSFARLYKMDLYAPATLGGQAAAVPASNDLASAMKVHGITKSSNAKGDRLTGYSPRSPKFSFVYTSARGTAWKCTPAQAKKRFG